MEQPPCCCIMPEGKERVANQALALKASSWVLWVISTHFSLTKVSHLAMPNFKEILEVCPT